MELAPEGSHNWLNPIQNKKLKNIYETFETKHKSYQ